VLAGCNVESVVDDINDAAVQTAFDGVKQTAEQAGGGAELVQNGAAVTLTINNPASPINGAVVVVPAGAVPADVANAVVAIQGAQVNGDISEFPVVAGPGAMVVLRKLPGLEDITPAKPLALSLPYYAKPGTYPAAETFLGTLDTSAAAAVPMAKIVGSAADEAKALVTGNVLDLKLPFLGIWEVTFAGGAAKANTLAYSVTKADGTTCAGFKSAPEVLSPQLGLVYPNLQLDLSVGNINPTLAQATTAWPQAVPVAETTFTLDATTTTFTCNAEVYALAGATTVTKNQVVFANYHDTQAIPTSQVCNLWNSQYCFTHHGSVEFSMELDYVTAAGDHVLVSAQEDLGDLLWVNIDSSVTP
jgi:hypothetical protein